MHTQLHVDTRLESPPEYAPRLTPGGPPARYILPLNEIVLPGGQPMWLDDNELNNLRAVDRYEVAAMNLWLPWAGAQLYIEMLKTEFAPIQRSMRSEPIAPARLALPDNTRQIVLTLPGIGHQRTSDAGLVEQVMRQLRELDRAVDPAELPCASSAPVAQGWTVAASGMAWLSLVDESGLRWVTVAFSTADECAFATSSLGGRVWLPAGFTHQLRTLLPDLSPGG